MVLNPIPLSELGDKKRLKISAKHKAFVTEVQSPPPPQLPLHHNFIVYLLFSIILPHIGPTLVPHHADAPSASNRPYIGPPPPPLFYCLPPPPLPPPPPPFYCLTPPLPPPPQL